MTRKYSLNPIICYLQHHDWEWLTAEQIINATKCAPNDLEALFDVTCYRCMIERQNGKYRYVGNLNSPRMKIVKTLKSVYPRWLSGNEIEKLSNMSGSVGNVIYRAGGLLPLVSRKEYRGKYQGTVTLYQYVPDDPRSLVEFQYTDTPHKRSATRKLILKLLKKHAGVPFSAAEISAQLGLPTTDHSANNLKVLRKEMPDNILISRNGKQGRTYYTYMTPEIATRDRILKLLKKHPGVLYSAMEITARLGLPSPIHTASHLKVLRREMPDNILTSRGEIRGRMYYTYITPEIASRRLQQAEHRKPIPVTA